MRIVTCKDFAPLDQLLLEDVPTPKPGPGQVLVEVRAAGVNFVDALLVQGKYQIKPPLPFTPGSEVAGVIASVGPDAYGLSVGDRVIGTCGFGGGFVEQALVSATHALPMPEALSFGQGASLIQSYSTALFCLTRRTTVQPGEWVLVLGAGGGIGLATVNVARALGARVIAAASSKSKLAAAKDAGAEATIDYSTEDLKSAARSLGGGGVDLVIDPVGGSYAEPALRALRPGGRFLVVGFAAGEIPRLPANQILLSNRSVIGVDWGVFSFQNPADQRVLLGEVLTMIGERQICPPEPTSYPLDQAAQALADLQGRKVVGKLVLVP